MSRQITPSTGQRAMVAVGEEVLVGEGEEEDKCSLVP